MTCRAALITAAALVCALPARASRGVSPFWAAVAKCETGSRWDWGSQRRPGEGRVYEGGLGFYAASWRMWAADLGLLSRYPHAYQAPAAVQARVAHYGLVVWRDARGQHGGWGCISGHAWIRALPGR